MHSRLEKVAYISNHKITYIKNIKKFESNFVTLDKKAVWSSRALWNDGRLYCGAECQKLGLLLLRNFFYIPYKLYES